MWLELCASPQTMVFPRIVLALVSVGLAALAFVHAASENHLYLMDPYASRLGGLDGEMASSVVDSGFKSEIASLQNQGNAEIPQLSDELIARARDSFANDPLEVSSLRSIALGSILQTDEERARRVMFLAAQMSKRDSITDLWLAQDYGKSGDVAGMMAFFDATLRTSERAREFAMNPVVNALATPESYAPLGALLARRPDWEVDFWAELAANPVGLANAANFFEASGIPIERVPENIRAALYLNLNRTQEFDALFRLAELESASGDTLETLESGKFIAADSGNPLAWNLHSTGNFSALIHEESGELRINGRSGSFGVAADRIVRGGQRLHVTIDMADPVPENAGLSMTLRCADETKRELARVAVRSGERAADGAIDTGGCRYVRMELTFNVDPGRREALLRVAGITLARV